MRIRRAFIDAPGSRVPVGGRNRNNTDSIGSVTVCERGADMRRRPALERRVESRAGRAQRRARGARRKRDFQRSVQGAGDRGRAARILFERRRILMDEWASYLLLGGEAERQ